MLVLLYFKFRVLFNMSQKFFRLKPTSEPVYPHPAFRCPYLLGPRSVNHLFFSVSLDPTPDFRYGVVRITDNHNPFTSDLGFRSTRDTPSVTDILLNHVWRPVDLWRYGRRLERVKISESSQGTRSDWGGSPLTLGMGESHP